MTKPGKHIFTCDTNKLSFTVEKWSANPMSDCSDSDEPNSTVNEATIIAALIDKLQHLSVQTRLQRPTHLTPALEMRLMKLSLTLDTFKTLTKYFQSTRRSLRISTAGEKQPKWWELKWRQSEPPNTQTRIQGRRPQAKRPNQMHDNLLSGTKWMKGDYIQTCQYLKHYLLVEQLREYRGPHTCILHAQLQT